MIPRFALVLVALAQCLGCGTRLTSLDTRAVQNQVAACQAIEARSDGGAVSALANACQCNGEGILRRAGEATTDAGACQ